MPLSKEDKILIKSLQECKSYNAWQFITEFMNKGWTKNSINRLLVKFGTVDRRLGSGRRIAPLMKTSTRLSCCFWVRKTILRAKRNFTWGGGIHQSFVLQIIHKVLRLKCYKKRRVQQLTEAHNMHALFYVCSLRDNNAIRCKPTWKLKHTNSILETSEYFCQIASKSIHIISSYTVSKSGRFFETQCRYMYIINVLLKNCTISDNKFYFLLFQVNKLQTFQFNVFGKSGQT